jgi:hypothetical protein
MTEPAPSEQHAVKEMQEQLLAAKAEWDTSHDQRLHFYISWKSIILEKKWGEISFAWLYMLPPMQESTWERAEHILQTEVAGRLRRVQEAESVPYPTQFPDRMDWMPDWTCGQPCDTKVSHDRETPLERAARKLSSYTRQTYHALYPELVPKICSESELLAVLRDAEAEQWRKLQDDYLNGRWP